MSVMHLETNVVQERLGRFKHYDERATEMEILRVLDLIDLTGFPFIQPVFIESLCEIGVTVQEVAFELRSPKERSWQHNLWRCRLFPPPGPWSNRAPAEGFGHSLPQAFRNARRKESGLDEIRPEYP